MAKKDTPDLRKEIQQWVREARITAGLSGEQLGARLALDSGVARGHTKGNISHWELGKHEPSLQQIIAISRITKFPLPAAVLQALGGSSSNASAVMIREQTDTLKEAAHLLSMYASLPRESRQKILTAIQKAVEHATSSTR